MKFKAEVEKRFRASDGTTHETREAHEQHERKILVERVAGYAASDFDAAVLGHNMPVATDIILLASLLRPPRAKRGSGQSAAGPTLTHTADGGSPQESTAPQTSTTDEPLTAVVSDQPPHEAPEAPDGRRAAAPDEQPEAAGSSPQPAASDPTLAQQLAHVGPHDGDEHYITGHHKRSPRGKASAGTAA